MFNPYPAKLIYLNFQPLEVVMWLCLATAIHNFKWLKITHICLICEHTYKSWFLNTHFVPNNLITEI